VKTLEPTRKNPLKFKDLAHQAHIDFLEELDRQSRVAYLRVMTRARQALMQRLVKDKLAKSKIKKGWTGDVPKVTVDFAAIFEETMKPYLDALRWVLMGDSAGRDARKAAKDLKLAADVVPGLVPAAYLNALDTHRQHFEDLFDRPAPEIKRSLVTESLNEINKRVDRFLDESAEKLKNRMANEVELVANEVNQENTATVHELAHDAADEGLGARKSVEDAIEGLHDMMSSPRVSRALRNAIERSSEDWGLMTRTDTSLASAVATHQALSETFGAIDDEIRVAWFAFRDEKTCSFCDHASRDASGEFKIYRLSEFAPAGTNYSRKKAQWILCVPPGHFNCRCSLVYIPKGFGIDRQGNLFRLK
jgi:hypothetical protein